MGAEWFHGDIDLAIDFAHSGRQFPPETSPPEIPELVSAVQNPLSGARGRQRLAYSRSGITLG
jgi:hypothetical protein